MLATRLVYLLLAFILSYGVSQPFLLILGGAAEMLPLPLGAWLGLAAVIAASALEFFAAGLLFTLLSGLSWRRAALWTVLGMTALSALAAGGPSAWLVGGVLGAVRWLACAAAGAYGCLFVEQRERAAWVEQARAMILSLVQR